jgi:transcriptional regulator with XRE-family HTH domain
LYAIIIKDVSMDRKLNRIKAVLADKGKTNKWLAEQLGKDPATVSKWCTNACQPSLEMMMTVARILDVEMNDLVRLEEIPDTFVK